MASGFRLSIGTSLLFLPWFTAFVGFLIARKPDRMNQRSYLRETRFKPCCCNRWQKINRLFTHLLFWCWGLLLHSSPPMQLWTSVYVGAFARCQTKHENRRSSGTRYPYHYLHCFSFSITALYVIKFRNTIKQYIMRNGISVCCIVFYASNWAVQRSRNRYLNAFYVEYAFLVFAVASCTIINITWMFHWVISFYLIFCD
jgi:hypothetical protein